MLRKRFIYTVTLAIVVLVMTGCAGMINNLISPPAKIEGMSKAVDVEKEKFVKKNFAFSGAHTQWANLMGMVPGKFFPDKPAADSNALKKVKKVAIMSFDFNVYAKGSSASGVGLIGAATEIATKAGINKEDLEKLSTATYDELKSNIEKQGMEVIPAETVLSNSSYQALKFEGKEAEVGGAWGGYWRGSIAANKLKSISASSLTKQPFTIASMDAIKQKIKENVAPLTEAGKAVGADAVILVQNNIIMDTTFTGKRDIRFSKEQTWNGVIIDIFTTEEPKLIWSAALISEVTVPTEGRPLFWASMSGRDYDLGEVTTNIASTYSELANLVAFKLKTDREKQ